MAALNAWQSDMQRESAQRYAARVDAHRLQVLRVLQGSSTTLPVSPSRLERRIMVSHINGDHE